MQPIRDKRRQDTSVYFTAVGAALLGAIIIFAASASNAETVEGVVDKVDTENNKLTISRTDDENKDLPKEIDVTVTRDADLEGIVSLDDLEEGNQVKVEVKENKDLRVWEADKIELTAAVDGGAPPDPAPAP
jgi:Cu/Ag efflux protein CusF